MRTRVCSPTPAARSCANELGVEETVESDNIVRWDGERLYVEQDVFHNGQLVHRKYRRTVTEPVARALWEIINRAKQ